MLREDREFSQQIFSHFLCNLEYFDPRSVVEDSYECFRKFFMICNQEERRIQLRHDLLRCRLSEQLLGFPTLLNIYLST